MAVSSTSPNTNSPAELPTKNPNTSPSRYLLPNESSANDSIGSSNPNSAPSLSHVRYKLEFVNDAPNGLATIFGTCPLDGKDGMFTTNDAPPTALLLLLLLFGAAHHEANAIKYIVNIPALIASRTPTQFNATNATATTAGPLSIEGEDGTPYVCEYCALDAVAARWLDAWAADWRRWERVCLMALRLRPDILEGSVLAVEVVIVGIASPSVTVSSAVLIVAVVEEGVATVVVSSPAAVADNSNMFKAARGTTPPGKDVARTTGSSLHSGHISLPFP